MTREAARPYSNPPRERREFGWRPVPRFRFLRELVRKKIAMLAICFIVVFYVVGDIRAVGLDG